MKEYIHVYALTDTETVMSTIFCESKFSGNPWASVRNDHTLNTWLSWSLWFTYWVGCCWLLTRDDLQLRAPLLILESGERGPTQGVSAGIRQLEISRDKGSPEELSHHLALCLQIIKWIGGGGHFGGQIRYLDATKNVHWCHPLWFYFVKRGEVTPLPAVVSSADSVTAF